ncbi:MAG: hypothetical protein QM777_04545 [Pseudorhodoferax sp.]
MTEFSEFPMDDTVADYPSHRELLAYFRAFAAPLRAAPPLPLRHPGAEGGAGADAPGTRWRLTTQTGTAAPEVAEYKGLVIANGTLAEPNMPRLPGPLRRRAVAHLGLQGSRRSSRASAC